MSEPISITIVPTLVWIESDILGNRHVVMQHQLDGMEPFTYATFYYDYRYTSNSGIRGAAEELAKQLGAQEPIEHRHRDVLRLEATSAKGED